VSQRLEAGAIKAKKSAGLQPGRRYLLGKSRLHFGYYDRRGRTDLHTTLAAQALFLIHRDRFAFLHLEHAHRANIDTLFVASALIGIDFNLPGH
jgi:hypothetical protein